MVLEALIPVGEMMLDECDTNSSNLTAAHLEVLQHVLTRLDADTAKCLQPNTPALKFFRRTLKVIASVEGYRTPQMMAIEQVSGALPSVNHYHARSNSTIYVGI